MTDMEEGEEFLSVCNTHISDEQQGDGLGSWAQWQPEKPKPFPGAVVSAQGNSEPFPHLHLLLFSTAPAGGRANGSENEKGSTCKCKNSLGKCSDIFTQPSIDTKRRISQEFRQHKTFVRFYGVLSLLFERTFFLYS